MGHVISPGKIEVVSNTTESVEGLKKPSTVTELRSFLGLCNVFRRFVRILAGIASPSTKKLRKDAPTTFDKLEEDGKKEFNSLKEKLMESQYWFYFDWSLHHQHGRLR